MRNLFHSLILILFPLIIIAGLLLTTCSKSGTKNETITEAWTGQYQPGSAVYVGREACKSCHEKEYSLFTGSDHDLAMDTVSEQSVLGNFNNASFTHQGITSGFYKKLAG